LPGHALYWGIKQRAINLLGKILWGSNGGGSFHRVQLLFEEKLFSAGIQRVRKIVRGNFKTAQNYGVE